MVCDPDPDGSEKRSGLQRHPCKNRWCYFRAKQKEGPDEKEAQIRRDAQGHLSNRFYSIGRGLQTQVISS